MIRIFLQKQNNKFYDNICLLKDPDIGITTGTAENIYLVHQRGVFDTYIFMSSMITREIAQFISEYGIGSPSKIFIYHDSKEINQDVIKYITLGKHIMVKPPHKVRHMSVVLPQNLLNNEIFYRTEAIKKYKACYFLDRDSSIPEQIQNSKFPIMIFNNQALPHYYNLGMVSEQDKAEILNESEYFIVDQERYYYHEALVCGCKLLDMSDINTENPIIIADPNPPTSSYIQFIKENLI